MAVAELVVEIRVAWWFRFLYLPGLRAMLAFCHCAGFWWVEPDAKKFDRVLNRAVTVEGMVNDKPKR